MIRPASTTYTVRRGDTLWRIAQAEYGDPTLYPEIARANHLPDPDFLLVGMRLRLPAIAHSPRHRSRTPEAPSLRSNPPQGPATHPSMPPTVTHTRLPENIDAHTLLKSGPNALSELHSWREPRDLRLPGVKLSFEALPPITYSGPTADLVLTLKGEVSLQKDEPMVNFEVDKDGPVVSAEIKKEYADEFHKLAYSITPKWDPSNPKSIEIEGGFAVTSRMGGHDFLTTEVTLTATSLKFKCKPREIESRIGEWQFKGNMGYELEVKPKRKLPDSTFVPVFRPVLQPTATEKTLWILLGLTIITLDIIKDVGTAGAGTAESPLSFEAAALAFARAGIRMAR